MLVYREFLDEHRLMEIGLIKSYINKPDQKIVTEETTDYENLKKKYAILEMPFGNLSVDSSCIRSRCTEMFSSKLAAIF